MAIDPKTNRAQAFGALLIELLNGQLSDETIAAIDAINRSDVKGPLNDLVGWMHGMSTWPPLMESQITSLLMELRGAINEVLEERLTHPNHFSGDWLVMSGVLDTIMGEDERNLRGDADADAEYGIEVPRHDRIPAWTRPIMEHIRNSKASGDELHLELLDVLEAQIQKRRAELKNTL